MRGRGSYPENWRAIAEGVKAEAGWRCVRCGHPNEPVVRGDRVVARMAPCDEECSHEPDEKLRILTVHHLDGDKGNCEWWNLPALCQVCHLQIQSKVRMDQTYLHKHSRWFLPYVAGYYASKCGGESLSRSEVEDRLEELLLYGQPFLERENG